MFFVHWCISFFVRDENYSENKIIPLAIFSCSFCAQSTSKHHRTNYSHLARVDGVDKVREVSQNEFCP